MLIKISVLLGCLGGSVERPTLVQVMILPFVGSSPTLGSVLTARSLEPAFDSVSPSLCPFPAHALSLSVPKINKRWKKKFNDYNQRRLQPGRLCFLTNCEVSSLQRQPRTKFPPKEFNNGLRWLFPCISNNSLIHLQARCYPSLGIKLQRLLTYGEVHI